MLVDILTAEYLGGYKIKLKFENHKTGIIDFYPYLKKGGVFKKFKDLEFFKAFEIDKEIGTLKWNNEIDIAPETLYSEATHTPLPEWMQN